MSQPSLDTIRTVFLDVLAGIAPEAASTPLDPGRSLRDQLDIDSVDLLNLMLGLHQRLGVDIPESDYARLQTVEAAIRYLGEKLAAAGTSGPPAASSA